MDGCAFCNIEEKIDKSRIIYQDSTWIAMLDGYPVSEQGRRNVACSGEMHRYATEHR